MFAPQGLDQVKCMKMCMVHDVAESVVGDITPFSGFEAAETPEAQFAQDIDKIDLLLQAVEYEKDGKGQRDLGQFMGVARKLRTEAGKAWADEILLERERFWEGREHIRGEQAEKGGVPTEHQKLQDAYYA
ncbi:hypothetical protein N0V84_005544 [Fusarium piperis]|uniref:HD domain-containing protein n=1 Tax=Fusarium piperis TaxID=1435070 RepID=A0A9W8WDH5_9HYPO|nr:hypothetical protein N0V84_005544 [Fusarium piperis]